MKYLYVWNVLISSAFVCFSMTGEAGMRRQVVNGIEAASIFTPAAPASTYSPARPERSLAVVSPLGNPVKTFDAAVDYCKKLGKSESEWRLPSAVELGGMVISFYSEDPTEMDRDILAKTWFSFVTLTESEDLNSIPDQYKMGFSAWTLGNEHVSEYVGTDQATIMLNHIPGFPALVPYSLVSPRSDLLEKILKTQTSYYSPTKENHPIPYETLPKEVAPFCIYNDRAPMFMGS